MSTAEPRSEPVSPQREWWLRTFALLLNPNAAFTALRDESAESVEARQEPLLAVIFLAGIAVVLGSAAATTVLDNYELDAVVLAVWAFLGGAASGVITYFVVGAALYLGVRGAGSAGSYRRARHVLGFALVPLALSLVVLWPARIAVFGEDLFRTGRSDAGTAGDVFEAVELGFAAWSVVLLVAGVRAVESWPWARALGAVALAALTVAAFSALPTVF